MYHKKKSKSSFKHVKGKINFFRFTDININYSYEILINTLATFRIIYSPLVRRHFQKNHYKQLILK